MYRRGLGHADRRTGALGDRGFGPPTPPGDRGFGPPTPPRGGSAPSDGRRTTPERRRRPAVLFLLVAGLALLAVGCADAETFPQNALDPAGPIARMQDQLWRLVFPIAVGVFILVQGGILYAVIRFRDRGGDELPKQIHGNTRLEVLWTLIPALVLAGIAVPTVRMIVALDEDPGEEALQVRVIGKQYWWEFEYDADEGLGVITANELHIPAGRPVRLTMESFGQLHGDPEGVIHSFWVPRLAGKIDVVPGYERYLTIEADEPGTYPGQCAEYCGLSHANMRFIVIAHTPEDFRTWLEDQTRPAAATTGLAAQGEEIAGTSCVACHSIIGHPSNQDVRIGPNLTHFASRQLFAGALFDVADDEQLRAWLDDPPGVKPGSQMPRLGLTTEEIEALIAYLRTLE